MAQIQVQCFKCQEVLQFVDKVGFRVECPKCMEDVHVCKNCEFYDPKVYNECRETSADVIREKARANFCEFFRPRAGGGDSALDKQKQALLSAAEALFKKKS